MSAILWTPHPDKERTLLLSTDGIGRAELAFDKGKSIFGMGYGVGATVTAEPEAWRFRHTHILALTHQRVHISRPDVAGDAGLFKVGTFGTGTLKLMEEQPLYLRCPSLASDDREWRTVDKMLLMLVKTSSRWQSGKETAIEAEGAVAERPDFPLLAGLGMYMYAIHKAQDKQATKDATRDYWWNLL